MRMRPLLKKLILLTAALLLLAACKPVTAPPPTPAASEPAASPVPNLPPAITYDLGEGILVQERFPEDSRFRNMPVRLNGVIAAPPGEDGPYPVVVILHGTHPGCPEDEGGVDRWPCDPAVERPNYQGFDYLVSELAAAGYVALSVNINAENSFGFGEPTPGERLQQLLDLHLSALAEAAAGGANDFGVDLAGRADLHRLTLFGHSRGGEMAFSLANNTALPFGSDGGAYGPVEGILLIAAATVSVDPAGGSRVPMAIVLSACDADVVSQDGQHFYEAARIAPQQSAWAVSAWLERANHNFFNATLSDDPFGRPNRPDCETILEPAVQRDWLADYAVDFLTTIYSVNPAAIRAASIRMGMNVFEPAPADLYGLPGRVAAMAPARNRLPLLIPAAEEELAAGPATGGSVTAQAITTQFCPNGFYTPTEMPGSEPCRRMTMTVPGQPALVVVSWEEPGGELRFSLPAGIGMLNFFDAISLRAAVDPLSPLNAAGEAQAISVRLTDGSGATATVAVPPSGGALQYPPGLVQDDDFFGSLFSGIVPMTTLRLPILAFTGVNLMNIVEVALLFDGQPSGTLFLADVELVRSPIGRQETLDAPPSAELIAAAEAGDVEAMRQLANVYRPKEAQGVIYGNLTQSVFWYRQACAAGYANAQVDFYEFARAFAETTSDAYLAEAIDCLDDAVRQGHSSAIRHAAFRAAFIDLDHARGFYLYALLEDANPQQAEQRQGFADKLTADEIAAAEEDAAAWRAANTVKDYNDFFAEVNSPFRQVP